MKKFVIALIVLVALVSTCLAEAANAATCTNEGETVKVDCNTCRCLKGVLACTKKRCVEGLRRKREEPCSAGQRKRVDCNNCVCSNNGQWACTYKLCIANIKP